MRIGDIEIAPLHDGCWRLPATAMYANTEGTGSRTASSSTRLGCCRASSAGS